MCEAKSLALRVSTRPTVYLQLHDWKTQQIHYWVYQQGYMLDTSYCMTSFTIYKYGPIFFKEERGYSLAPHHTWMKTEVLFEGSQRNSTVFSCVGFARGSTMPTDIGISVKMIAKSFQKYLPVFQCFTLLVSIVITIICCISWNNMQTLLHLMFALRLKFSVRFDIHHIYSKLY